MSARSYGIDSMDGNALTTGLQEAEVHASAQRLANHLGADVQVYSLDGAEDDDGDWHPAESWTISPSAGADDDPMTDAEIRDEHERDERALSRGR